MVDDKDTHLADTKAKMQSIPSSILTYLEEKEEELKGTKAVMTSSFNHIYYS